MESKTFTTPGPLALDVRVPAGRIDIYVTDTTETRVEITGERDGDDVIVECSPASGGGHRLLVAYRSRKAFGWIGGLDRLHVSVRVPLDTQVEGESGSADLTVSGDLNGLAFSSGSGDLRFADVHGDTTIKVASGDAEGGAIDGSLTAHSASGDVRVASVGGAVLARTASGDVRLGRAGGSVQATTASGDVWIDRAETGRLNLKTVSGDVTVGVTAGTKVWLDLSSTSGDAISELDGADGEGSSLEIHAASVSGDIVVRRASA